MCLQFTYPEKLRPQPVIFIFIFAAQLLTMRIAACAMAHVLLGQGEALLLLNLQVQLGDQSWTWVLCPQGGQALQHNLPPEGCQLCLQAGLGEFPPVGVYMAV